MHSQHPVRRGHASPHGGLAYPTHWHSLQGAGGPYSEEPSEASSDTKDCWSPLVLTAPMGPRASSAIKASQFSLLGSLPEVLFVQKQRMSFLFQAE